jgi:DNA-binding XRE family transcriptional regulator
VEAALFYYKNSITTSNQCEISFCTLSLRKEVSRMKILVWEMRTSKGFTLMELSKKSGIGKSTINNIENGKVSPTLFQLEMIAIALGVKITDLFESEYK